METKKQIHQYKEAKKQYKNRSCIDQKPVATRVLLNVRF
jgi:hypothetical protein